MPLSFLASDRSGMVWRTSQCSGPIDGYRPFMARSEKLAGPSVPSAAQRLATEVAAGTLAAGHVPELAQWLEQPRFRAFVEANQPKVRRKLRDARAGEAVADVLVELRVARLLLADRRFELGFETYGRGNAGPDFTLRFRAGRPTDLEVTRRRPPTAADGNLFEAPLLGKLRQLQPSVPSVLLIATEAGAAGPEALVIAARGILDHAEAGDEAWLAHRGIPSVRVFWAGFHRLGAVIAWRDGAHDEDRTATWVNPSARIRVDPRVTAAIEVCLREA
jgi:hypothetical protein